MISLLSGGLDSRLAVLVLKDQGLDVHAVAFDSPFFELASAKHAARQLSVPLHIVNYAADILSLLDRPKHGFGSCMNPCVDCHALMLRRAGAMLDEHGFHFISSGEVLNQRPMSQNRRSLALVAEESGYGDLVVRPLSARLLPETLPERLGWVDRSRLLSFSGRGRRPQLRLAEEYGLDEFPSPAGGCRLTEPNFCKRLGDLQEHEGLRGVRSISLLKLGRHFRLAADVKIIVGRNERDNSALEGMAELYDLILRLDGIPGPTGILPFTAREEHVLLGAAICARYAGCDSRGKATVKVRSTRGERKVEVLPATPEEATALMIA